MKLCQVSANMFMLTGLSSNVGCPSPGSTPGSYIIQQTKVLNSQSGHSYYMLYEEKSYMK